MVVVMVKMMVMVRIKVRHSVRQRFCAVSAYRIMSRSSRNVNTCCNCEWRMH